MTCICNILLYSYELCDWCELVLTTGMVAEIQTENGHEMVGTDIVTQKIDIATTVAGTRVMTDTETVATVIATAVIDTETATSVTMTPVIDRETAVSGWKTMPTHRASVPIVETEITTRLSRVISSDNGLTTLAEV